MACIVDILDLHFVLMFELEMEILQNSYQLLQVFLNSTYHCIQ